MYNTCYTCTYIIPLYSDPVELIDVYPTINDLLQVPYNHERDCKGKVCHQLQGISTCVLYRVVYIEYSICVV